MIVHVLQVLGFRRVWGLEFRVELGLSDVEGVQLGPGPWSLLIYYFLYRGWDVNVRIRGLHYFVRKPEAPQQDLRCLNNLKQTLNPSP